MKISQLTQEHLNDLAAKCRELTGANEMSIPILEEVKKDLKSGPVSSYRLASSPFMWEAKFRIMKEEGEEVAVRLSRNDHEEKRAYQVQKEFNDFAKQYLDSRTKE